MLATYLAAGAGLAAAHRVGIVHRDFKPDNVMVGDDGRVRVLDFGLARSAVTPAEAAEPIDLAAGSALTRDGAIVGTPGYMAPEQDRGGEIEPRSDMFSFCAALYEALYGRLPFDGATYREMAENRMAGRIVQPPALRGVSARVRRAIVDGLAVDPENRHRDMDALLVELGRRPRLTRKRIALAVIVLAAAASGGWALWARSSPEASIVETCAAAGADVGRVWNPVRRDAMARSFAATGHPDAAALAARAVSKLDGWAREWEAKRIELCEMPMRRVPVTERFVADRLQCLERHIGAIDALVTVYIDAASRELLDDVDRGVSAMPRPSSCDELVVGNATDEQKTKWAPAMRGLVQAKLALAANRNDEAARVSGEIAAQARAAGDTEPLCAALMLLGFSQGRLGKIADARTSLRDSVRACTEVREESLAADAWLELVSLGFASGRLDAEIEETIFGAELAMLRLPPDDLRGADLAYRAGTVHYMHGDPDRALARLNQAKEMWTRGGAATYRLELGAVENTLGLLHVHRGEWDEALAAFERAMAAWKAAGDRGALNAAVTTGNIGTMRLLQKRYAEAEPLIREQLAVLEARGEDARALVGDAIIDLGILYALTERCAEAHPILARGLEVTAEVQGPRSALMAVGLLGQGLCQLDRGAGREAVATLERSRQIAAADPIAVFQRPRIAFALAQALWATGRRARAIELAREARTDYEPIAGARAYMAEVEAWLAKRDRR